jgi:hypothetical protein
MNKIEDKARLNSDPSYLNYHRSISFKIKDGKKLDN